MSDQSDVLAGMDDVPWDRLVHFCGRASDIPPAIRALGGAGREEAIRHLRDCLEHQDGVIQATPFAVRFILRMRKQDPEGVQAIIQRVARAAEFMLRRRAAPRGVGWDAMLAERYLWPPFISEFEDEMLWEEWDVTEEEPAAWAVLTLREIAQAESAASPATID